MIMAQDLFIEKKIEQNPPKTYIQVDKWDHSLLENDLS